MKTLEELLNEQEAKAKNGNWIAGCGGTEVPFKNRQGRRVWYMWQPTTGRHGYLDMDTDIMYKDIDLLEYLD